MVGSQGKSERRGGVETTFFPVPSGHAPAGEGAGPVTLAAWPLAPEDHSEPPVSLCCPPGAPPSLSHRPAPRDQHRTAWALPPAAHAFEPKAELR